MGLPHRSRFVLPSQMSDILKIFDKKEKEIWSDFYLNRPDLKQAHGCLNNVPAERFWSLANHYLDPVSRHHVQVRIMEHGEVQP